MWLNIANIMTTINSNYIYCVSQSLQTGDVVMLRNTATDPSFLLEQILH